MATAPQRHDSPAPLPARKVPVAWLDDDPSGPAVIIDTELDDTDERSRVHSKGRVAVFECCVREIVVLPVGEGACSVFRRIPREWPDRTVTTPFVTIVDCGSGSTSGRQAAQILSDELSDADWRALRTIVVTHYDADHWRGLEYVARANPSAALIEAPDLTIYSPAVPFGVDPRLPDGLVALISATSPSGVEALDLEAAWGRHVRSRIVPVAEGDRVEIAGRSYEVLWPPLRLSDHAAAQANDVLVRILALADRLANDPVSPDSTLTEALERAYTRRLFGRTAGDESTRNQFGRNDAASQPRSVDLVDEDAGDEQCDHGVPTDDTNDEWFDTLGDVPRREPLLEPLLTVEDKRLLRQARALQNALSLVFHDAEDSSLIVYGDAPPNVVGTLADRVMPLYKVMLPPHHGTHETPWEDPAAIFCLAQGGPGRYRDRWLRHHRFAHGCNSGCIHVSDYPAGDVRFSLP
jgi:glyoxylase-like metal-dependent hydrolase (beta-lactamase superfamily II)